MFPMVFVVELQGVMTVRDKRRFNKLIKLAMRITLFEWLRRFFDRHFTKGAPQRYPGVFRKRRSAAGRRGAPNVQSGKMKRMLKQFFRVTGTIKQMTGTMRGPSYTDLPIEGRPDKAAEITFVNASEEQALARFMEKGLAQTLQSDRSRKTLRISA